MVRENKIKYKNQITCGSNRILQNTYAVVNREAILTTYRQVCIQRRHSQQELDIHRIHHLRHHQDPVLDHHGQKNSGTRI
jgi:hypothetical protein